MTTKLAEYIQQVTDPQTQRALHAVFTAVYDDLALLRSHLSSDGIVIPSTLAIGTTPENVSSTDFGYVIDGLQCHKAVVAAGTAFGGNGTVNTAGGVPLVFGGWAWQINAAGTITALPASGDQVYTTAALALAYAQSITPTAGNVVFGYSVIGAKASTAWRAGTDDLTPGSDCQTAAYYSVASTIPTLTLTE
jgi:hypothetical protein